MMETNILWENEILGVIRSLKAPSRKKHSGTVDSSDIDLMEASNFSPRKQLKGFRKFSMEISIWDLCIGWCRTLLDVPRWNLKLFN